MSKKLFRWGNDDQVIGSATIASSSEAPPPPSSPSPTRLSRRPYDNVDPSSKDNPPDDIDEGEEDEDDYNNMSRNNDSVLRFLAFLFSSDSS
jgi:hypothetical protein